MAISLWLQVLTWLNLASHITLIIVSLLNLNVGTHSTMRVVGWLVYLWLYWALAGVTAGAMMWEGMHSHGHWRQDFYRSHVKQAGAHLKRCTYLAIAVTTYWAHYKSEPHEFLNVDLPTLIFKCMGWMFVPMFGLMTADHAIDSCVELLVFAAGCCTPQHKKD